MPEEAIALFSCPRAVSRTVAQTDKPPPSQQKLGTAASQRGWWGKRQRDWGTELQKPPSFLSYEYIHYLTDERLEKAFYFFLSHISKELISMINLNWD